MRFFPAITRLRSRQGDEDAGDASDDEEMLEHPAAC